MADEAKFSSELKVRYSKVRDTVKNSIQKSLQSGAKPKEIRSLRKSAFFAAEEKNSELEKTQEALKAEQEKRMDAEEEGRVDHLTKLLNRRGVLAKLGEEVQRAHRERREPEFFVIFMDVNNLKHVNDNHGHDAGDMLLKEAARILMKNARPDDITGRWTQGDELVVFLEGDDPDDARILWERVSQEFQHYSNGKNGIDTIWISAGLAKLDPENVERSIDLADRAMRLAKETAKGYELKTHKKINMLRAERDLQVPLQTSH